MAIIIPGISGGGISNGYVIEGVAHITDTIAPTTRPDGSALVAGDKWYSPTNGTWWFWNGTYWLSSQLSQVVLTSSATANVIPLSPLRLYAPGVGPYLSGFVFIEKVSLLPIPGFASPWGDVNNYQTLIFRYFHATANNQIFHSLNSYDFPLALYEANINTAYSILGLSLTVTTVGSPVDYAANVRGTVSYRNIAP